VGGLAAAAVGLRVVFLGGGILLLLSTVPVLLMVQEGPIRPRLGPQISVLALIRQMPGTMRSLNVLISAQGLISVCNSATQVLVVLRLLEMAATTAVAAVTGVAFGLAGVASSFSAVFYTQVTRRLGYVRTTALSAAMVAVSVALIAVSPWVALVVAAVGLTGLFSGVVQPATASMIGLETPRDAQSTVFGANASSVALGFAIGPLIGGGVAATANVEVALLVISALALGLAVLIATGAREPAR
jgi:MFS family permease